jgi:hypothetical protein
MGISALMADRSGRSFAFENGKRVECFDDCASLRLINRERYHTLTEGEASSRIRRKLATTPEGLQ